MPAPWCRPPPPRHRNLGPRRRGRRRARPSKRLGRLVITLDRLRRRRRSNVKRRQSGHGGEQLIRCPACRRTISQRRALRHALRSGARLVFHQRVDKKAHPVGHQVGPAQRIADAVAAFLILEIIDGRAGILHLRRELAGMTGTDPIVRGRDGDQEGRIGLALHDILIGRISVRAPSASPGRWRSPYSFTQAAPMPMIAASAPDRSAARR